MLLSRRLDGSVSPTASPLCAGVPVPLVSVKTNDVVPPSLMLVAPNVLATLACTTVKGTLAAAPTPVKATVPPAAVAVGAVVVLL